MIGQDLVSGLNQVSSVVIPILTKSLFSLTLESKEGRLFTSLVL